MIGLFKGVTPYIKPKPKLEVPRPDNLVFRLHYRLTFTLFLVASILVTSYSYIDKKGGAIQCMIDKGTQIDLEIINRYCWITSTFTLPKHYEGPKYEGSKLEHGIGTMEEDDEKVYHAYYQWVPFLLILQGIMFYAPHWIWKQLEGGRMKHIIVGLNKHIGSPDSRQDKVDELASYMKTRMRETTEHKNWAFNFFMCELLNFVNVVAQIFITDRFLGYQFTTYGSEVMRFPYDEPEDRVDPMSRIFPKMTKCTFYRYGGSGTIQNHDAFCVLGMNILNEKIYIFLWFWFLILAAITGVNIVMRLVQMSIPSSRSRYVELENYGYIDKKDLKKRKRIIDLITKLNYSDWLILYYLNQAMKKENFLQLLDKLSEDIGNKSPYKKDDSEAGEYVSPDSPDGTLKSKAKLTYGEKFKGSFKRK